MKLEVTARIYQCGSLVGYQVTDGMREFNISKAIAWRYAKGRGLLNVRAFGTEEDLSISGINGFELRNLPKLYKDNYSPDAFCIDQKDILAAEIRIVLSGINISKVNKSQLIRVAKNNIKLDLKNHVITSQNSKTLSQSFSVIEKLVDKDEMHTTVGYTLLYTGCHPVEIERMNIYTGRVRSSIIYPDETICLSRADLSILGAKPEIVCTFSNGYIREGDMAKGTNKYDRLAQNYFVAYRGLKVPKKVYVKYRVSDEELDAYFIRNEEYTRLLNNGQLISRH